MWLRFPNWTRFKLTDEAFFRSFGQKRLTAALNRSEKTSLAGGGEGGKRTRPLTSSRPERRGFLRLAIFVSLLFRHPNSPANSGYFVYRDTRTLQIASQISFAACLRRWQYTTNITVAKMAVTCHPRNPSKLKRIAPKMKPKNRVRENFVCISNFRLYLRQKDPCFKFV